MFQNAKWVSAKDLEYRNFNNEIHVEGKVPVLSTMNVLECNEHTDHVLLCNPTFNSEGACHPGPIQ